MRFLLFILISSIVACGYQFQGSGSVLPTNIKTVYIEDVENNTTESGLGIILTEALKDRFDRYGTLSVVDSKYSADAVLNTEILEVTRQTRSVTSQTDSALQLETSISVASDLKTANGLMLWNNPGLKLSKSFGSEESSVVTSSASFASSGLNQSDLENLNAREVARGQEQQVLEDMSEDLARKVYEEAVLPEF